MVTTGNPANNRCQALTRKGEPCRGYRVQGSRFCFWHAPSRARQRKAARSAGGRARHGRSLVTTSQGPVEIRSIADVVELLGTVVNDVLLLENSVARARALGSLASVLVGALRDGELERRLLALEELLNEHEPAA